MKKKVIAFDLDNTLAVTKSAITDEMSGLLGRLLERYQVCVISGGKFEQFKKQLISNLRVTDDELRNLHIFPSCGTRYYRFDHDQREWVLVYAEDLDKQQIKKIIEVLARGAKELGYWETEPHGEIIEDRGSQVTFSALGQYAPPEKKYAWDPDDVKKHRLREYAAKRLSRFTVSVGGTTSVDVTKKGIDKAYGMGKLKEILGVGLDEILFIGDRLKPGGNDYPVKTMGIDTIAVADYTETPSVVRKILR